MQSLNELKATLAQTPPVHCDFAVGDKVTFTNDNGIAFPGLTVIGFEHPESIKYGRFIYLDYDCYWFPANPERLRKEGDL